MFDTFPIQNCLKKKKKIFWYHCFSAVLIYAIRRAQEYQEGMKLNGTHRLSVQLLQGTLSIYLSSCSVKLTSLYRQNIEYVLSYSRRFTSCYKIKRHRVA